ncbi:PIR protein [Plasmodium yoelii]|uniref:PIR protein n=3 Tax=Plasmodium yoelii TaxID=5861 RepID=A0AAF0B6K8_PLAYO|nr:PIR protein [Plasmodium yoelii]WBY61393.1 PIR protein [Plasmodium yoelii yoelii]VTZ82046.1 PIR protein [Plasmodium yoelii]|eukprot:XP_022810693.1 PIR protein [Plasmodium yoelii]
MNKEMCIRFKNVREWISDELIEGNYQFKDNNFLNNDCNRDNILNNSCNNFKSDFDKISAGCLYLLDQLYRDCGVTPSPARNNINIVDYILIWLSYMLNLDKTKKNKNINDFYSTYINSCDKYMIQISELTEYDNYKGLIDARNYLLYMNSNLVSKFYKAFKSLCEMYNELDDDNQNCNNYLEDDNEFFKKYDELNKDSDINKKDSYRQLLSTLLTDYYNFKTECKSAQERKHKDTTETIKQTYPVGGELPEGYVLPEGYGLTEQSGETGHISEVTSSSSIVSKLIPVVSIFAAISIFLGISYKYSLFGFRKRVQKHLRKILKK